MSSFWFLADCHHGHHLLPEHKLPLLHGAPEHPHMTSDPVARILTKRPLLPFMIMVVGFLSLVLYSQLVTGTDLSLNLTSSWSLSWTLCLQLAMLLPAVGFALDVLLHVLSPTVGYALSFLLHVFALLLGMLFSYPLWVRSFLPAVGPLFWLLVTRIIHLFVFTQSACSPSLLAGAVLAPRRRCLRVSQSRPASAVPTLSSQCGALVRQGLAVVRRAVRPSTC